MAKAIKMESTTCVFLFDRKRPRCKWRISRGGSLYRSATIPRRVLLAGKKMSLLLELTPIRRSGLKRPSSKLLTYRPIQINQMSNSFLRLQLMVYRISREMSITRMEQPKLKEPKKEEFFTTILWIFSTLSNMMTTQFTLHFRNLWRTLIF